MFFNLFRRKSHAEKLADIDWKISQLRRIMDGKEYSPTISRDKAKQKLVSLRVKHVRLLRNTA